MRPLSRWSNKTYYAYGTSDLKDSPSGEFIRVTKAVWMDFSGYVKQAVRHVLIHELRHIMLNCRYHIGDGQSCIKRNENKGAFDNVLETWGYYK